MKKHLTAIVCFLTCGGAAHAGPILNTNWVVNGDAESGVGSSDGSIVPVPDWNAVGLTPMFTAIQYQSSAGGFPAFSDPGPASRGVNFFDGGNGNATAQGAQNVDVSSFAAQIDAGQINFVMSAYLGGFADQNDFAVFNVLFLDAGNGQIGVSPALSSPTAAARSLQTELVVESFSGTIPTGTRTVEFLLSMTRQQGLSNDGYADNLSFVASSVGVAPSAPEPASFAMFGIGGVALAVIGRRARNRRAAGFASKH